MISFYTTAKSVAKQMPLYSLYKRCVRAEKDRRECRRWISAGRPVPPPHKVKQQAVIQYATEFGVRTFVETGTFHGDMVNAVAAVFDYVYSIELGEEFYQRAKRRFADRDHITILQGDSGEILGNVLNKIEMSCVFWLDGHYSGGATAKGAISTPIQRELRHIADHPAQRNHITLIDDARLFTGQEDYPTIPVLEDWARSAGYEVFQVKDDIIRIHNGLPARGSVRRA